MADPLRRTLLAKLRGKKSKKGATLGGGGGFGSAAAANGSRGGKEKVVQTQRDADEALPVVLLTGMDLTAERMSTYENCVEAALVRAGGTQEEPSCGGRGKDELLLGVPLLRDEPNAFREDDGGHRGPRFAARIAAGSPYVQIRPFVSVPRQRSVGDSIGFGDSSCQVYRGAPKAAEGTELRARGVSHMAQTQENKANWTFDSGPTLETDSPSCAALVFPTCSAVSTEENVVIRNIESYDPDCLGDTRETAGSPQSPAFFPTELQICDIKVTSLCATQGPHRHPLDSDDDDYYDNEILPFYETARPKTDVDRGEVEESGQNKGQVVDGNSAQETDRLRNQLQEAYYLLINAMNDMSLDFQQIRDDLAERQATSSCSSRSRDSLCSRLSVKNIDSDSWSSGGNHSSQQGSDTESLLLCLTGNLEPKSRLTSKSMSNLSLTKRPTLLRSASDGAIRYQSRASAPVQTEVDDDKRASEAKKAEVTEADGLSEPRVLHGAVSSEELLHDAGGEQLNESSGSVNSLTGSSDSNMEAAAHQGQEAKQEQTGGRTQAVSSANKAHGVTVNKMQEWMHKGRLLSSEMKQRIEGSSLPRGGGQTQTQDRASLQAHLRPGTQTCVRGGKSVKTKSSTIKAPRQQQPAFIENFQAPCANDREVSRSTNEPPSWRPQLTTITVSKKRNWLQQSSQGRGQFIKDELQEVLGAEEEGSHVLHQLPPPPSPSPDHLRHAGGAPPRPVRLQLPQVTVGPAKVSPHPRMVDPAEENDADDEGEIWYNPIPEDDEPRMSHQASVRLLVPPRTEPQRRPSRGLDLAQGSRTLEGSSGPEGHVDSLSGGSGDAAHSAEAPHLHRQMLTCKPQEEGGLSLSKPTDGLDLPSAVGFSPPSSPNPTKKSSSINWSFPDKIKSPRTVRKISMKISRKLSVKGTQSSNGSSQLEPRAHSPRANGSGSEVVTQTLVSSGGGPAGRNVISRYHLDSSVSTQHSFSKKKSNGSSKSASKGGYLSDGDSPELLAKSGKHGSAEGKGGKGKETDGGGTSRLNGTELDIDAFRHYSFTEQPKCSQYISGLMSLHFYGAEDLKPPRVDSRDVYCAIQVDSVNKARTALLTCRTSFLDMDHTFNIELENAQHLKLVVFSWEPTPKRNRVCCHGTVVLPTLFRVTRTHQLAVKLEPRGLIYVKLNLMEQWQNSLDGGPDRDREPQVFGVEAWRVVERENTGLMVPLIISSCINEIEKRGCQVVGLYRLCGSAAVKKELREAFERDSHAVELCEGMYPDINVITGVLKDYLRELPYPLINKPLYEAVLETMAMRPLRMGAAGCENDQADSEHTVSLLENLPEVERMTLRRLLDHLKLVASYQEVNKMTCQNLAVCFGPVLLSQRQEASCHTNRVFIDSEELASALHFKKHIEVLHYLLQLWPVVDPYEQSSSHPPAASVAPASSDLLSAPPPLRRRKERPQVLNFSEVDMAGVLRPKPGRLDSPSNRYAGDWSGCGENYFPSEMLPPPSKEEADYDDVPSEDTEAAEEVHDKQEETAEENQQETDPAEQEQPETEEVGRVEEEGEEEMKDNESDTSNRHSLEEEDAEERRYNHILPPHTYQAYMKIQDLSPVLSNRVNLRDLQESIDTLIGNLERELNKNKLNVGY
ncbi:rho GTPase-activating protein SYDE2 [Kryptolebias marmoratus]|uniref:rho GTPase-activating protein SYDE2 n=1 Tax=Kryptolebias marmoratus TaxID=37003 RepID=UPI0007F92F1A|nr:rho GTPase-activating protein SYDE2 [Kryptolebias marmoratus]